MSKNNQISIRSAAEYLTYVASVGDGNREIDWSKPIRKITFIESMIKPME